MFQAVLAAGSPHTRYYGREKGNRRARKAGIMYYGLGAGEAVTLTQRNAYIVAGVLAAAVVAWLVLGKTAPTASVKELGWSKPFVIDVQPDMDVASACEYWNEGEYQRAFGDLDKAIRSNPANASTYNDRGLVSLIMEDYDRAIHDLDKAIELNPANAKAYYNRGITHCANKEYDLAIRDFDRAIELSPVYTEAYNSRGFAYVRKGWYYRAIREFDKAIELDPEYAPALKNLSLALAQQGKSEVP